MYNLNNNNNLDQSMAAAVFEDALFDFGRDLREKRELMRISRNALANQSSISTTTLAAVEKGNPSTYLGAYGSALAGLLELTKNGLDEDLQNLQARYRSLIGLVGRLPRNRPSMRR